MHPRFHAASDPDKAAATVAETGETLTYGTLERHANQGAQLLRRLGLANGDTIAIWLPNGLGYYEIYWAAQRAGLYIVPISTALTAAEATYILHDSGAGLLITSGHVRDAAQLVTARRPAGLAHILTHGESIDRLQSWSTLIAAEPDRPVDDERVGYHLVYSSGTTGRPKGVRLPLQDEPATVPSRVAEQVAAWYGCDDKTVFLSPAPMYHTAPLAISTAIQRLGGTVVLMQRFDAEAALAAIARYGVTFTQMVPTMLVRLLRLPDDVRHRYDLSSLKSLVHAAAPCPVEVKRRMIDWLGPIVLEYYGGSEGNGTTFITSEEWLRKPGSVGKAVWGRIHICHEDGGELPVGTPGMVYFEGGWHFEYLNDPEKTAKSRHPLHAHWSMLGDVGYLDADGYLFLTDRASFMIISGGVNVYPQEIENLLATFPGIADAAVFGVPHAEMGEEVMAIVEPLDWADAGPAFGDRILAHCRAHLSPIKVPRSVVFERSLPRHDTGKLYKRLLRDRYWTGYDKRIH